MKKVIEEIFAAYARLTLLLHKPKIVGITGSVGKSTTKEAIWQVLSGKFAVQKSPGNLNSELGLPLAVLGFEKSGGYQKNFATVLSWLWILVSGFFRIFQFDYPKILVLEMGADKPGDIARLLGIVDKLDVAVVTDIGVSHLEFFKNEEQLKKEKLSILNGLSKTGTAVLCADNPKVMEGKNDRHQNITYGFEPSDVQGEGFAVTTKNGQSGVTFKVNYKGTRVPFFLPKALGQPVAYASLAAASVGLILGMNMVEISERLENFSGVAGRLRIIPGLHASTIIDDTYNAAPSSVIAALVAQKSLTATRYLLALGAMAELGAATESGHREVAARIVESNISEVFLVGEKTKIIQDELHNRKFSGKVFWRENSDSAADLVAQSILPGDVILVKGSQSARMEKIVKKIMKDPGAATDLLVRQGKNWV